MSDVIDSAEKILARPAKCQAILEGAVKAFEQQGYDGASMDLVSKLAGVSKRTVYNYFESKEALLWAVLEDLMSGYKRLKQIEYVPEHSLESQIEHFIDAELYFVTDPSRVALARILISIFARNSDLRDKARKGCELENGDFVAWLKAASQDGRLVIEDFDIAAKVFYGLIEGLFNFPALFRPLKSKEDLRPLIDEAICVYLARYAKSG